MFYLAHHKLRFLFPNAVFYQLLRRYLQIIDHLILWCLLTCYRNIHLFYFFILWYKSMKVVFHEKGILSSRSIIWFHCSSDFSLYYNHNSNHKNNDVSGLEYIKVFFESYNRKWCRIFILQMFVRVLLLLLLFHYILKMGYL